MNVPPDWLTTNPAPIPQGRIRQHLRDGAPVWQLQCPLCGRWGDIDDDQLHGRVSADHTEVVDGERDDLHVP